MKSTERGEGMKLNEEVWWWEWISLKVVNEKSICVLKRSSSERLNAHGLKTKQTQCNNYAVQ